MGTTAAAAGTATEKATVQVTYKRRHVHLAYHARDRVEKLRDEAIEHFDIDRGERKLALFTADGRELDAHSALHDAGVGPGDRLVLGKQVLEIIYNGRAEEFAYKPKQSVAELLKHALERFGVTSNAHLMSLFDVDNRELPEGCSVRDAEIDPGETLVLRQSIVKGG